MTLITIVGLGPGDPGLLTREAWTVLSDATEIYVRTARHPTLAGLPATLEIRSFDHVYEETSDFEQVYESIASTVIELGRRTEGVLYGVPGDPHVGEATVMRILELASAARIAVRIISGLSFIEPVLNVLGVDGLDGLQIVDAMDVATYHHPPLDPDRPALLAQLYSRMLASEVKLTLLNQYAPDHEVKLVHAAGTPDQRVVSLPLVEIDRRDDLAHLTTLYIPPLATRGGFAAFQEIIAHLRAPDGCPWDREQTHQTLRSHLLEETYEVLEALDAHDADALREELGDLLLQVVLQTQIATDEEEFRMSEVIEGIREKLVRRHPHVFGDTNASNVDEVKSNWEAIKQAEHDGANKPVRESILDGVTKDLPALAQAEAYGTRAARVGFDWPDVSGVIEKVAEEIQEIAQAQNDDERQAEYGDLLFALVNVARWTKIDPEAALRTANARWSTRFREVERTARKSGRSMQDMSIEELDDLWEAAKAKLNE